MKKNNLSIRQITFFDFKFAKDDWSQRFSLRLAIDLLSKYIFTISYIANLPNLYYSAMINWPKIWAEKSHGRKLPVPSQNQHEGAGIRDWAEALYDRVQVRTSDLESMKFISQQRLGRWGFVCAYHPVV